MKVLDTQLAPLLKFLDGYYSKAPVLPKGGKDFIVKASPWLALLGAVFALFAAYGLYQAMSFVSTITNSPFYQAYAPKAASFPITVWLSIAVLVVWAVIYLLAFSPLKAEKLKGWNLILYGMILNVVANVVTLSPFSIIWSIVGFLIGYYFLYQVKSYYK